MQMLVAVASQSAGACSANDLSAFSFTFRMRENRFEMYIKYMSLVCTIMVVQNALHTAARRAM